jgi:hypothetical protein
MPKFYKKGKKGGKVRKGGRKLNMVPPGAGPVAHAVKSGIDVGFYAKDRWDQYMEGRAARKARYGTQPKKVYRSATQLSQTDNITTLKSTIIGKRRPLSFDERVSRVERPPILFKRNYQFNAEGISGRKAWFSFEFNSMNNSDLQLDLTTYKSQQFTDTAAADPNVSLNTSFDGAKFYVDYLSEKLQMVNSSTNAIIGKIHLFAQRRDNNNSYAGSVPITPINLMLYYSTQRLPLNVTAQEATVGNGWKFDTATSGLNYNAVYNMPGSVINSVGVTAQTDFALSPSSPHIADSMSFWFRKVDTQEFTLKPGQQLNKTYLFNDLQDIMREEQSAYSHLANISYSCVVEYRGGIVGDIGAASVDVSTGTPQLSVMRESKRVLGVRNKLKSKIYLVTSAPTIITQANQQIINPDTGVQQNGAQID